MQRDLRRKERAIDETAAGELLERGEYGILSTSDRGGRPYGVPLSYCVLDGAIYFHCATHGHKLENLADNSQVSFCVVGETEVLPAQFATRYQSVVVSGEAAEVYQEEKQLALEGLVAKYSPEYHAEGVKYIEAVAARTRVFRIAIDAISGKARR